MTDEINLGDVCLDLTQGRPVHVLEIHDEDADDWSESNNYELTENYGNSRLGATGDDRVYEVAYCSSLKSKPSKSYAIPESRLVRVETEAADGGRVVADRVRVQLLERLTLMARSLDEEFATEPASFEGALGFILGNDDELDPDVIDEARELADVERTIGGADE